MEKNLTNSNTLSQTGQENLKNLVADVLVKAKTIGATAAEVGANIDMGLSVNVRMGEVDTVEFNRDKGVGISVYFGQRKGSASTSDTSMPAIESTLQAACDIATVTAEDPCTGLAEKKCLAFDYPDLALYQPWALTPEEAISMATKCEVMARAVDPRINNSEGVSVSKSESYQVYGNSHGFIGAYPTSRHTISCVLVASDANGMQRDYYYSLARDATKLDTLKTIANIAAKRTVDRLGGRKIATCKSPVIFHAQVARGLLSSFTRAISGTNLYRKASFLLDHLGKPVFPAHIQISEQPHLLTAIGSAPFDADGVKTKAKDIVCDGVLESYLLSTYSARRLGLQSTGNAGGVHNLTINSSDLDLDGLLREMGTGLLVTELIGHGINLVTGDYSRGATGFWVEGGEIQYPVEEITIASNLKNMFQNLRLVANDVDIRGSIRSGSILIDNMMIAGR